jgi:FtsP/CotA-like multicopper oxidase with cupredoxin domain
LPRLRARVRSDQAPRCRIPAKNGAWTPGRLQVIVDFRDPIIKGLFVFHCHILDHEDSGMMATIRAI